MGPPSRGTLRPSDPSSVTLSNRRGCREDRVLGQHPWPPCGKKCTGQEPQAWPIAPGLPCATVYGLYVLSSVHRAFWPPCVRQRINVAHGYQRRGIKTTRLHRPQKPVRRHGRNHAASSHVHRIPHPTFVTTAKRPSGEAGCADDTRFPKIRKKNLFGAGQTASIYLMFLMKKVFCADAMAYGWSRKRR
jgi:hypothetical protein